VRPFLFVYAGFNLFNPQTHILKTGRKDTDYFLFAKFFSVFFEIFFVKKYNCKKIKEINSNFKMFEPGIKIRE